MLYLLSQILRYDVLVSCQFLYFELDYLQKDVPSTTQSLSRHIHICSSVSKSSGQSPYTVCYPLHTAYKRTPPDTALSRITTFGRLVINDRGAGLRYLSYFSVVL